MIVFFDAKASPADLDALKSYCANLGLTTLLVPGQGQIKVCVGGPTLHLDTAAIGRLRGVTRVLPVHSNYKLSARQAQPAGTVVTVGNDIRIGGEELVLIAGPCAIESEESAHVIARSVRKAGANLMRGGVFKARTSPYAFQGTEEEGFRILASVREETGMRFVTEAVDERSLELVEEYSDMIQIGARNMQNFALLKKVGACRKPVLLKRGLAARLEELLLAADYIMCGGNAAVALCERGIRTFSDHSRNTLDLGIVPAIKELSHLPVVVDPSHGAGIRRRVPAMALASVAAGADAIMLEVHNDPEHALSDGEQSLALDQFAELVPRLAAVAAAINHPLGCETAPARYVDL